MGTKISFRWRIFYKFRRKEFDTSKYFGSVVLVARNWRAGWIHVALRNTLPARSTVITEIGRLAWRSTQWWYRVLYRGNDGSRSGPVRRSASWLDPHRTTTRLSPDAHSSYPCPQPLPTNLFLEISPYLRPLRTQRFQFPPAVQGRTAGLRCIDQSQDKVQFLSSPTSSLFCWNSISTKENHECCC